MTLRIGSVSPSRHRERPDVLSASIRRARDSSLAMFGVVALAAGCAPGPRGSADVNRLSECLSNQPSIQYHSPPPTPQYPPMPVTYASACPSLTPDTHPVPWTVAVVASDDRQVSVYYPGGTGPCERLQRIVVSYGRTDITIDIFLGSAPQGGAGARAACSTAARAYVTNVLLSGRASGRILRSSAEGAVTPRVYHL